MSKWIDADALMNQWCDEMCKPKPSCEEDCAIYDYVRLAPSIDIVRCKECKWLCYCETEDLDLYLDCDKPDGGGIPRSEEWFCADGKRKEGE